MGFVILANLYEARMKFYINTPLHIKMWSNKLWIMWLNKLLGLEAYLTGVSYVGKL